MRSDVISGHPTPRQQMISEELESYLYRINPWWKGHVDFQLPKQRRWLFAPVLRKLRDGLVPIVAVCGPPCVGKTTLQMQIIQSLLDYINPNHILRVNFDEIKKEKDEKLLEICYWFEEKVFCKNFNEAAKEGQTAYIFFDEIQHLESWSSQLKHLVDHNQVRVLITSSSTLPIGPSGDSLAGRITVIETGGLTLREIARWHGLGDIPDLQVSASALRDVEFWRSLRELGEKHRIARDAAFDAFIKRGGFPRAQMSDTSWEEICDEVVGKVVQRHRRASTLLKAVISACCQRAGEEITNEMIRAELKQVIGSTRRIAHYLRLLNETMLVRLIPTTKLGRDSGVVVSDHSLCVSLLGRRHVVVEDLAKNIVGYFLSVLSCARLYFHSEASIDFVLAIGGQNLPIQTQLSKREALRAFVTASEKRAPFGLIVGNQDCADDQHVISIPLSTFLLLY